MQDTLDALQAAIINAPSDRAVRLVFADALDESGDPASAARAAFIRSQIELETMRPSESRWRDLAWRCEELFAEHWVGWWRPVCAKAGLPEPYVPKPGLGNRLLRLVVGGTRAAGAPYFRLKEDDGCTILCREPRFGIQFRYGFPELLYFTAPSAHLIDRLVAAMPLARVKWVGEGEDDDSWRSLDRPALAKVTRLELHRLPLGASALACSPHLAAVTALQVHPLSAHAELLRHFVHRPTWARLRSLELQGLLPPDALRTLANRCTLEELEVLSFALGEVPPLTLPGVVGEISQMASGVLEQIFLRYALPPGPIRWPDYWPALIALARSPMIPRLRELRIWADGLPLRTDGFAHDWPPERTPPDPDPENVFPDAMVNSLADGLNPDKLERLVLPAARLALESRAELTRRFGTRVVLA